ncbi:MAG: dTDP-4-dehydrorhamnose reductase [Saprospiraceae bacterium]|nr:dTDP-4-dehydrorhamnose reductase [Saprospiraceae bacterium]MDW8230523.1 dTDP-4-dehydrorhamnose reductase [Saprospiraceae bacterium]
MPQHPILLITGANGQLGRCFEALSHQYLPWTFVLANTQALDITNRRAVRRFFEKHRPNWCLNCAAYTAVDRAESEPEQAQRVNALGPRHLAETCAQMGCALIHFSTDYVYHGRHYLPIREDAPTRPRSVYARTKLAGDRAVLRHCPEKGMIIRTSWLYSPYGHNFAHTIARLGRERSELRVVFDQIGTPTYAPHLAEAVLSIIERVHTQNAPVNVAGIWHYSNEGVCSWYDFAQTIADLKQLACRITPIRSEEYPTAAVRPPFSVLDKAKIKTAFAIEIPHWRRGAEQWAMQTT